MTNCFSRHRAIRGSDFFRTTSTQDSTTTASQRRQLLLRIRTRIDFRMRLRNLPVLVDDVGDAARVFVLFRLRRAVSDADLAIGVAQERKREVEFLRELRVRLPIAEPDSEV